jgi:hypothetical protein
MPNSVQVDGVPRLLRTLEGLAAKAREEREQAGERRIFGPLFRFRT